MEAIRQFRVSIQGIGTKLVPGTDGWHARQNAIAKYSHLEADTSKYSKGLVSC
jgi:hypothetical protein